MPGKVIDLDWKMPFAALWRVDWSTADKLTDSWEMLLQHPDGKYVMQGWFGQDESEGQRFGKEFGPRDWNKPGRKRWNPVLGSFAFPCWIDNDGRGYLQPLKERRYAERGQVYNFAGPAIIYPIDRVQGRAVPHAPGETDGGRSGPHDAGRRDLASTSSTSKGRSETRGAWPRATRATSSTPSTRKAPSCRTGPVIEEQLDAAVAFIRNVRERIDAVREVRPRNERVPGGAETPPSAPRRVPRRTAVGHQAARPVLRGEPGADPHARPTPNRTPTASGTKLLTYTGQDAYQKCAKRRWRVFTSIGGCQDGLVASCRMIVKTLRQRAGIAMAVNPELKEIATEIRARTQAILRKPDALRSTAALSRVKSRRVFAGPKERLWRTDCAREQKTRDRPLSPTFRSEE